MRLFYDDRPGIPGTPALYVVREHVQAGRPLVIREWPELGNARDVPGGARELDLAETGTRDVAPAAAEPTQPDLGELRAALEARLGDHPRYTRAALRRALDDVLGPMVDPSGTGTQPATASYAGNNSERQSVGLPGHCDRCAQLGHVAAHSDLGCSDVGCTLAHGGEA